MLSIVQDQLRAKQGVDNVSVLKESKEIMVTINKALIGDAQFDRS